MSNANDNPALATDYDSVYDFFCHTVSKSGNSSAIQYMNTSMSFDKMLAEVNQMADFLLSKGIREGSVISIVSPMIPSVMIMYLAANKIGAVCSIIDIRSTSTQIKALLAEANSEVLLILDKRADNLDDIISGTSVRLVIFSSLNDYLSANDRVFLFFYRLKNYDFATSENNRYDLGYSKLVLWREAIDTKGIETSGKVVRNIDSRSLYLHHSSLLDYKGIEVFTNKAILSSCFSVITDYKLERLASNSRCAVSFMNYAYNGTFVFSFLSMLCAGITLMFVPFSKDMNTMAKALIRFKPGIIVGYPAVFTSIVEAMSKPKYRNADLSFIRLMIATGSSFVTTKRKFCEDFLVKHGCHIKISVCYGLTECLSTGSYVPRRVDRNNSIGIPFTGVMMKVFDSSTHRELQAGEKGEICICSAGVLSEVLGDEVMSARIIQRHRDGKTWIHTGDIGHRDEEGYFYFDYVEKRCANIGGISVSLKQIEDVIKTVYGVFDVCVVDFVDESGKTCIIAQVVPIESYMIDNDLLNNLVNKINIECEMMLSSIARPSEIEFRAYLPRVGSEVDYKTITKDVIERYSAKLE